MVTHDCPTCFQPMAVADPDCPTCEGDGYIEVPDRFERLVGVDRAQRICRPIRRTRRRIGWARARWAERNADTVAAVTYAHRNVLDDEPRLRSMIDGELRYKLENVTPLRWRQQDVRWCLMNAKRAALGQPMLALPWEDMTSIRVNTENFERGLVAILAERHRRLRA